MNTRRKPSDAPLFEEAINQRPEFYFSYKVISRHTRFTWLILTGYTIHQDLVSRLAPRVLAKVRRHGSSTLATDQSKESYISFKRDGTERQ